MSRFSLLGKVRRGACGTLAFLCVFSVCGTTSVLAAPVQGVIRIESTPKNPGSNTPVTIQVKSYAMDLGVAHIIWYVNGQVEKDEVAGTSFSFQTGDPGTDTTIDAVVIMPTGRKYRETMVFSPVDVDLLWEADTYTPPFYKGKALPTHESPIRAVALPFPGATSSPYAFNYSWSLGSAQNLGGGLGKNTTSVLGAWPRSKIALGVSASRLDGSVAGRKTIQIQSVDPKVLFYEEHPLAGVRWNRVLTTTIVDGNNFALRAFPYFFANNDLKNAKVLYTWTINGKRQTDAGEEVSIAHLEGSSSSVVNLSVENTNRVLQVGKGSMFVEFK